MKAIRPTIECPTCGKAVKATQDYDSQNARPSWRTHMHKTFRGVWCNGGHVARVRAAL